MSQIIKSYNKKIKSIHSTTHSSNQCNCRNKKIYPLLGKCLQKNVEYRATVKTNSSIKQYIGATEGTIKQRIYITTIFHSPTEITHLILLYPHTYGTKKT